MTNKKNSFFESLEQFKNNHWFWHSIITIMPAIVFTILEIAPKQLNLLNDNGDLHKWVLILFWVLIVITVFYSFLMSWVNSSSEVKKRNGQQLLSKILTGVNNACDRKSDRFIEYIEQNVKADQPSLPFNEITQPKMQIDILVEELNNCLSMVIGMDKDDIGISIMYCLDNNNGASDHWEWLCRRNLSQGLSIKEILRNENSSARQIIDGKYEHIFVASKIEGQKKGIYIPDRTDANYNNVGSILCRDISCRHDDKVHVGAILSITTYGKTICSVKQSEEVEKKLINTVIRPFESRIKMELSLLHIKTKYLERIKKNRKNTVPH